MSQQGKKRQEKLFQRVFGLGWFWMAGVVCLIMSVEARNTLKTQIAQIEQE